MGRTDDTTTKYLIVNERDRLFGLFVNTVGRQEIGPGVPYPPVNHPSGYYFSATEGRVLHEYQLVYITQGQGTFSSTNHKAIDITAGQAILIHPGLWHTYYPSGKTGWNEYYIGFNGPIVSSLIEHGFLSQQNQILDLGLNEDIVSLFHEAFETAHEDKPSAQQHLAGIVLHLIGLIISANKNKLFEQDNLGKKIESAKIYMRENISADIDWEALSAQLNVSYSWFRKVFKDYTGCAPAKYFQELKLHKAKEWLANTNFPIKKIAYDLGYSNAEHFFATFKKNTGITPTEFRNNRHKSNNQQTDY